MKPATLLTALPIIASAVLRAHAVPIGEASSSASSSSGTSVSITNRVTATSLSTPPTSSPAPTTTLHGQHLGGVGPVTPPRPTTSANANPCGIVPIVYPVANTEWDGASHHNVTWNTDHLSDGARDELSQFMNTTELYIIRSSQSAESYLPADTDKPAASGFPLSDGQVEVPTPMAIGGDTWQVLIYADRGQAGCGPSISQQFKILNIGLSRD